MAQVPPCPSHKTDIPAARASSEISPTSRTGPRSPRQSITSTVKQRLSIQKQPPSRFIEDLPEWKPYHLLSPTHRRRLRSPTRSHASSNHSQRSHISTRRRCCGLESLIRPRIGRDGRKTKLRAKLRKGCRGSSQLDAGHGVFAQTKLGHVEQESHFGQHVEVTPPARDAHLKEKLAMSRPIKRQPSKLKKRPPRSCASLRGSTYSEWRSSMVLTVSADVSRRSSKRTSSSGRYSLTTRQKVRDKLAGSTLQGGLEDMRESGQKRCTRSRFLVFWRKLYRCGASEHELDMPNRAKRS